MRRTTNIRLPILCTAVVAALLFAAGTLPTTALATQETAHLAQTAVEHVNLIATVGCFAAAILLSAVVGAIRHIRSV